MYELTKEVKELTGDKLSEKRQEIIDVLGECNWVRAHAAKRLNMNAQSFCNLVDRLQIHHPSMQWPMDRKSTINLEKKNYKIEQISKIYVSKSILQGNNGGPISFNINMNQSGNAINSQALEVPEEMTTSNDFELLTYIESLPQPRMRNLIKKIYKLTMMKFSLGSQCHYNMAAEWLGINQRTLYRTKSDSQII
jgi:hypothetical protein